MKAFAPSHLASFSFYFLISILCLAFCLPLSLKAGEEVCEIEKHLVDCKKVTLQERETFYQSFVGKTQNHGKTQDKDRAPGHASPTSYIRPPIALEATSNLEGFHKKFETQIEPLFIKTRGYIEKTLLAGRTVESLNPTERSLLERLKSVRLISPKDPEYQFCNSPQSWENAYYSSMHFMVVCPGMIEESSPEHLVYVMGHELGHALQKCHSCRHVNMGRLVSSFSPQAAQRSPLEQRIAEAYREGRVDEFATLRIQWEFENGMRKSSAPFLPSNFKDWMNFKQGFCQNRMILDIEELPLGSLDVSFQKYLTENSKAAQPPLQMVQNLAGKPSEAALKIEVLGTLNPVGTNPHPLDTLTTCIEQNNKLASLSDFTFLEKVFAGVSFEQENIRHLVRRAKDTLKTEEAIEFCLDQNGLQKDDFGNWQARTSQYRESSAQGGSFAGRFSQLSNFKDCQSHNQIWEAGPDWFGVEALAQYLSDHPEITKTTDINPGRGEGLLFNSGINYCLEKSFLHSGDVHPPSEVRMNMLLQNPTIAKYLGCKPRPGYCEGNLIAKKPVQITPQTKTENKDQGLTEKGVR